MGALVIILLALGLSFGVADHAAAAAAPGAGPCAVPDALRAADEDKAARKAYVKVLEADPTLQCASKGLAALNAPAAAPAADSCKIGNAYLAVHRDEDAIAAFKKGLEADPGDDCASEGLDEAGPGFFARTADGVLEAIPVILVWVGLALVAGLLVLMTGYWSRAKRALERLWLIGRLARPILSPRLTFEPLVDDCVEGKPGAPIMARIKVLLGKMRDEAVSKVPLEYDLDFGTPSEQFADLVSADKGLKRSLDNASDISEQTKVVAALLNLVYSLLPVKRFEISGFLEPPAASVAAASLVLEDDAQLRAGTTVSTTVPASTPGASEYMTLVEPAAVWIQFEVARAIEGKAPDARAAQSRALLDEGLRLYRSGKARDARNAHERALLSDPRNWAAYVSLVVVVARTALEFETAMETALEGLTKMEEEAG